MPRIEKLSYCGSPTCVRIHFNTRRQAIDYKIPGSLRKDYKFSPNVNESLTGEFYIVGAIKPIELVKKC